LSQIAGWSAAAAVFKANIGLDLSGSEFYDVRTAYLVFFCDWYCIINSYFSFRSF
jgi:hypothetical protein